MNFTTLKFEDDKLVLLDQTLLPKEKVYLRLSDYREAIEAIKMLRVRGAPAIGIAAAYAAVLAVMQADNMGTFYMSLDEIKHARPTAVNLAWAIDQIIQIADERKTEKPAKLKETILKKALQIHEDDIAMCERMGENGAELIKAV